MCCRVRLVPRLPARSTAPGGNATWGSRSPGPECVPGAYELLFPPGRRPRLQPQGPPPGVWGDTDGGAQGLAEPRPMKDGAGQGGAPPPGEACCRHVRGGRGPHRRRGQSLSTPRRQRCSHSTVCGLKTQALEKCGLLVSFSTRLRARLPASFGVKGHCAGVSAPGAGLRCGDKDGLGLAWRSPAALREERAVSGLSPPGAPGRL